MSRLSQAIAEGDGISFVVEVSDAPGAQAAEAQGADALAASTNAGAVRDGSQLPVLHLGRPFDAQGASADAVVIEPDPALWDEAHRSGLECVVRVTAPSALERALDDFDPEVFLLSVAADADEDDDPLAVVLELLHDVPAGKLAIAELRDATADDVAELERSGVDAVLVSPDGLAALVQDDPPDV
jgi:hypothetical protein